MDLFIRSQCGCVLKKVENKIMITHGGAISIDDFIMGEYKTEQRAIEVLDEIQSILDGEYDFEFYQMPKE